MILLAAKIAPALLAGNTVVAKPAATTPLAALKLGELCADILPPGVINVIVDANDLGDAHVLADTYSRRDTAHRSRGLKQFIVSVMEKLSLNVNYILMTSSSRLLRRLTQRHQ
jgi:Aldehyde dehydrogenase family